MSTGGQDTNLPAPKTQPQDREATPGPKLRGTAAEREVAERVAAQLHEPHAMQILRLVQIFGAARVEESAAQAQALYAAAHGGEGLDADTRDAVLKTKTGEPRTLGGVFFVLMRRHAEKLGLNWFGLFPAQGWQPRSKAGGGEEKAQTQTQPPAPQPLRQPVPEKAVQAGVKERQAVPAASPAPSHATISQSPARAMPEGEATTKPKASRLKTTVVGTLSGAPRFDAASGLVELPFTVEMSPALPKGLPNLGTSRVMAICTRKQFDKVAATQQVTPQTRFLIEGEAAPAVNRDLVPFLKVVALRLSTPELDQAARVKVDAPHT